MGNHPREANALIHEVTMKHTLNLFAALLLVPLASITA